MCGLAGIVVAREAPAPARDELRRMLGAIAHRGPDGTGGVIDGSVALVHARLAVVDLEFGQQPLSNADRSVWIAFNGEVFNHPELRARLARAGRHCRTRSDTEVIVHAYEEWGDAAWELLEGQFAIALLDRRERAVRLVRDRAGICPLFVARTNDAVLFASEIKGILASGRIAAQADPAGINAVFRNWAVPGNATPFEGIEQIEPGHGFRIEIDGVGSAEWRAGRARPLAATRFARLRGPSMASEDAGRPGVREALVASALDEAVHLRLRADIPVGAYLSGGLDSTLLVALMARARRETHGHAPSTFSIRFRGSDAAEAFDEGSAQKLASEFLGTTHRELVVEGDALVGALEGAVWHAETPLLRAGPLPMLLLSRFVREQGFRVVLTGEGADELFGGYDLFKEERFRRFLARDPRSRMRRALAARLHGYRALPRFQEGDEPREGKISAAWTEFLSRERGFDSPYASHALRWHSNAWGLRFLAPEVRAALDAAELAERVAAALPADWRGMDEIARAQELEIAAFMIPSLLSSQGDRMLLASGVEGRFPFLDGRVAEVASSLSMQERLSGLREKPLLRRVARGLIPEAIATRRKWPYRAPIQAAFFGPSAGEVVRECLSQRSLRMNPLIDAGPASRLAERVLAGDAAAPATEREQMTAIGLVTLELWRRQFLCSSSARRASSIGEIPFVELSPITDRGWRTRDFPEVHSQSERNGRVGPHADSIHQGAPVLCKQVSIQHTRSMESVR